MRDRTRDLITQELPDLDAAGDSAPGSIVDLREFDDARGQPDSLDDAGSIETRMRPLDFCSATLPASFASVHFDLVCGVPFLLRW
jgi:hypothetical protein